MKNVIIKKYVDINFDYYFFCLGIDCGGVRREWFNLVSSSLFDTRNKLFKSFSDSKQALAHPNPRRPSFFNLKDFEFAGKIVGKCLFESALGGKFR